MRRALTICLTVLVGCQAERGVLLELSSSPGTAEHIDSVCLVLRAHDEVQFARRYDLDETQLPAQLAVVTESDSLENATAVAWGQYAGRPRGRAATRFEFPDDSSTGAASLQVALCAPSIPTVGFVARTVSTRPTGEVLDVTAEDLDGDGIDEVVELIEGGPLRLIDDTGDVVELAWTAGRPPAGSVAAADVDLDCLPDNVLADSAGLVGSYASDFDDWGEAAGELVPSTSATSVALGDTNGDGVPDLMVGSANGVTALAGDGAGGFDTTTARMLDLGWAPLDLAVAEVNGIPPEDLVAVGAGGARALFRSRRDSSWLQVEPDALPAGDEDLLVVVMGDLDHDGLADAAAGGPDGLRLWRNEGGGRFTAWLAPLPDDLDAAPIDDLAIGDADGDCRLDLLVMPRGRPTYILTADASGAVAAAWDDLQDATAGAIGDFNGDGRPDLFLALETERVFMEGRE